MVTALVAVLTAAQWLVVDPRYQDALAVMGSTEFQVFQKPPIANDFPMGTLDGRVFSLSDLKGRVVLLNFWRKNCPYCVHEKGYLKQMVRGLNRTDLEVLCVNLWDSPSWIHQRYGEKKEGILRYATKSDDRKWVIENTVRGRLMGYYVVNEANEAIYEVKGFPSTYVIDKRGRIVATHMGMVDWTSPEVRKWLLSVLGPRPATDSAVDESPHANPLPESRGVSGIGTLKNGNPVANRYTGAAHGADYQLPEWLDRLLAHKVSQDGTPGLSPEGRALMMPRRHGLVSEKRPGLPSGPDRW